MNQKSSVVQMLKSVPQELTSDKPIDFVDLQRHLRAAHALSIDKARCRGQTLIAGKLEGLAGAPKDIWKTDPLPLPGIEAAIDYGEFENYVVELQRRRPDRARTLAVKIGDLDRVYDERSSEEFRSLVRGAAQAIQETLLSDGGALSFRGNGVFLCILQGRRNGRRNALQYGLNSWFYALHPENGHDLPQLAVSERVPLGTGTTISALESLASAVECAEYRNIARGDVFKIPRGFLKRPRLSDEQRHLEKRAFEYACKRLWLNPRSTFGVANWRVERSCRAERGHVV